MSSYISLKAMEGNRLSAALNSSMPHATWEPYEMGMLRQLAILESKMLKQKYTTQDVQFTGYTGGPT